jgi:hypothetical protein
MLGGYIYNHENEKGGEALSKAFAKGGKVQLKTIEKKKIFDHCIKIQHLKVCTNYDCQQQT